jgi:pilus assembly protein FimV
MKKTLSPASDLFKQTALCCALSLSVFGSAQALTLSRPIVQSKQGEVLRAEIDVTEISISEQIELQAAIASPEVYKAAKIEMPTVNGQPIDVQIQLLRRDHGWPFLKITSTQPVNSNFLDLLIDLRWATGGLLRDVSLSLDSTNTKKLTPAAITAALDSGADKANKSAASDNQIRVKRGDTASALAASHTSDSVSLEQMLIALLRSNPNAFVESNINRMKEGALLTLPTEQEAKAVSLSEARKAIQIQTKDFEAYRAELAARAPGGTVPKVARDAAGMLEAKIDNKNAKRDQDKLTLSKPSAKDAAAEKIAQQREAEDVAARAAELNRNIAELGKIAAAASVTGAASAPVDASSAAVVSADVPASAAQETSETDWLTQLSEHALAPYAAGGLIGLLILMGFWRRRVPDESEDIQGLPPVNVQFKMDMPEHDAHQEPVERAYVKGSPSRPTMEMPDISLDLNEPNNEANPFKMRIDLADELWKLGQQHTSKALMEEVANEATGAEKEQALQWLAERA